MFMMMNTLEMKKIQKAQELLRIKIIIINNNNN